MRFRIMQKPPIRFRIYMLDADAQHKKKTKFYRKEFKVYIFECTKIFVS